MKLLTGWVNIVACLVMITLIAVSCNRAPVKATAEAQEPKPPVPKIRYTPEMDAGIYGCYTCRDEVHQCDYVVWNNHTVIIWRGTNLLGIASYGNKAD